ncbi:MAG: ATP synthase F1 subunit epsilon [Candidatus Omnitrophica bacterium CG07_land_8_20_14_0_80_50_8]|nr:MAG: ATP synthase F1 subunit epsilon [Candidatus Omnitrophica bacterium CG1_02_49_16]PIU40332.1 MAG: ATP synthase F1 subunit epsilon [Candidatus Omnitrophica bacterium CG07_land_8_20_14_0_80_50_8]
MADTSFTLKIVTPTEVFFEGQAVSVVAPGALGYLGILQNHAPFITTVSKGDLIFRDPEGKTQTFKVEDGFLEVLKNKVLILTDKVQY